MPFNVNDPLAGEGGSLGIQGLSNNEVDAVRQKILSWTLTSEDIRGLSLEQIRDLRGY